jgi:hypothetical protein
MTKRTAKPDDDLPPDNRAALSSLEELYAMPCESRPAGSFPDTQWTALLKPLARRIASETEILERLFQIYRPAIVAFIRSRVGHPQGADELAPD